MALILHIYSTCVICCLVFVFSQDDNYQKQINENHYQRQHERKRLSQKDNLYSQQSVKIINSTPHPFPTLSVFHEPLTSSESTPKDTKVRDVASNDLISETTTVYGDKSKLKTGNDKQSKEVKNSINQQTLAKDTSETTSFAAENSIDRIEKIEKGTQMDKRFYTNVEVDKFHQRQDSNEIEIIHSSKKDDFHHYSEQNPKRTQNIEQEQKVGKDKTNQETTVRPSIFFKQIPQSIPLFDDSKKRKNKKNNQKDNNRIGDENEISERQTNDLIGYDEDDHVIDDEVNKYTEKMEFDDEKNFDEKSSNFMKNRNKKRIARSSDKRRYHTKHNSGRFGYKERNKDRFRSRGRSHRGKGKDLDSNGYEKSHGEIGSDMDSIHYGGTSSRENYNRANDTNKGRDGGRVVLGSVLDDDSDYDDDGRGEGRGFDVDDGEGGGKPNAEIGGQDRLYVNGYVKMDDMEKKGYSDLKRKYQEEMHDSPHSPPVSRRSYQRYTEKSDGLSSPKASDQKTCHICNMKKMDREVRLRSLKAQIIKQIGFNKLPNITKNNRILSKVPTLKHIIENMTMQRDEPSWRDSADEKSDDINEQMIITAEKPSHLISHFNFNLSGLCYFNLSGKLETSVIKEASLWLYLRPINKIRRSTVEVRIWNAIDMVGHTEPLKTLKVKMGRFGEWTNFKATSIIKQWLRNTQLNYGLHITAFDSYGNNRIWTPNVPNHEEEIPVMDIKFSPRRHSRHRRTVSQMCTDEEHTGRCCLYPLMVDFLEMKWYWVIYPHHFEANYCSGNCSLEIIDDTLPYAYIGFKSATTIDGVRCCTSTREGELQILYYTDSNKIVHTYLEDIVVKECGCR